MLAVASRSKPSSDLKRAALLSGVLSKLEVLEGGGG